MCDYSLHLTVSRPAVVGEKLITTVFANSMTRGLSAEGKPNVAVCLSPGTQVAFDNDVECTRQSDLLLQMAISERVAQFRQVNRDRHDVHHDALEFPSGLILLIHNLCPGQHITVLQLPAPAQVWSAEHGLEQAYSSVH